MPIKSQAARKRGSAEFNDTVMTMSKKQTLQNVIRLLYTIIHHRVDCKPFIPLLESRTVTLSEIVSNQNDY